MKSNLKDLLRQFDRGLIWISQQDRYYLISSFSSIISAVIIISVYIFAVNVLPDRLPLFYSLPWGQTELASRSQFLILPAIITTVALINTLLAWQLHPSQYVLKRILLMSNLLINFTISLAAIKIVFIFA